MSTGVDSTIFVLTETPGAYGTELIHEDKPPIFVKDIETLISRLKEVVVAGLVLEIDKVMKATRQERDRLFNYAGNFPVMRTKLNPRHGFVAYLDPKDCFFKNLEAAIGKRCRSHERVPVNMGCAFSREYDPIMADVIEATLLDISPGGCCINTRNVLEDEQFLHLRIPQLKNARPIYSSIRWTRVHEDPNLCGMGVMFIDLQDDQMEEILALKHIIQP